MQPYKRYDTAMLRAVCLLTTLACLAPPIAAEEPADTGLRIATFNVAMGLEQPGELAARLEDGKDERLQQVP